MTKKPKSIKTPPTNNELQQRLDNVRELMNEQKFDFYVCFDPVNIYYLTNFAFYVHERPFLLVIGKNGPLKMVVPLLEKAHVIDKAIADVEYYDYYEFPAPKGENWFDVYQSIFDENLKVGIESSMPIGIVNKTPGETIISDIVEETRIIKTDYEIGRITHACKIVNKGLKKVLKMCRPEVAEFAIFQECSSTMTSKIIQDIPDANFKATETMGAVWPPSISHEPHLVPGIFDKMEEAGPHVTIIQAQVDGYGVEVERTFFLGDVPEKAVEPFNVMFEAREMAYNMLKPGTIMSDIDSKVRQFIGEKGYGEYIIHRTGHGFGITGHEAPYIAEGYHRELKPNMVVSIEPGIYIPEIGGFRHSDTVLITNDGYVKLTKGPETLDEVTIEL
ncbi:MAG: M24 family metallopeptidase [Candidatus Lokiarchaeota archaeon]|nr:M24 family metallopeptidase [Candidatus Lokiarchaeota archaeon]MBD3199143.1 M24 family metallopeptidase [Candidatus Lokiarchaeota archaeon]